MKSIHLDLADADTARLLAGAQNAHLKRIERQLGVKVGQRGTALHVTGPDDAVGAAQEVLHQLTTRAEAGHDVEADDVENALRVLAREGPASLKGLQANAVAVPKGKPVAPRSAAQQRYLEAIRKHPIVFGVGPAGTGKTYLAMAMAVAALVDKRVKRIVLTRPAVEAGEKLGFLPGDLAEKVDPYLRPLYDALHDMLDSERAALFIEQRTIEVAPLAFMRGRTLNDCFAILDEAQNTTVEQMKMFLTRLGQRSQAVVTGDVTQIDLPAGKVSGLVHAQRILRGVEGVAFADFSDVDVVRHPVVQAVVRAYDKEAARGDSGGDR